MSSSSSSVVKPRNQTKKPPSKKPYQNENHKPQKTEIQKPPPWSVVKGLLTCKYVQTQPQQQTLQKDHQKSKHRKQAAMDHVEQNDHKKKCKKAKSCISSSLCRNTKVTAQRPRSVPSSHPHEVVNKKRSLNDSSSSCRSMKSPLKEANGIVLSSTSFSGSSSNSNSNSSSINTSGSFRGMPFRRFSGCYECKMVVNSVHGFGSTRDASLRTTICVCPECGEIFINSESLDLHLTVRHAVSELGPEDTSKNIVEIIFQSSWLKKRTPICKIHRILKVHNTQKTVSKFEEYRDTIKSKAKSTNLSKKHERCIADGNELLRFHCTTFKCSLGINGSTSLCNSIPRCNVCSIIKYGFKVDGAGDGGYKGILTTATSGKADDEAGEISEAGDEKRAMLVCRVIAGRVKKKVDGESDVMEEYDSVGGEMGVYSNLDELYVFNPMAILPCFVVIYGGV